MSQGHLDWKSLKFSGNVQVGLRRTLRCGCKLEITLIYYTGST